MGKNWQNLVDAIQIYLRFLVHFFLLKAQKTQNLIRRCLIFIVKFVWCGERACDFNSMSMVN